MISSGSESADEPIDAEAQAVKAESDDDREVAAEWRGLGRVKEEVPDSEQKDEPWVPERVSEALRASSTFKEFMEKRRFNFVHLFSGERDVLGEAIKEMAGLQGIQVRGVALDKLTGTDLGAAQPFNDFLGLGQNRQCGCWTCRLSMWQL